MLKDSFKAYDELNTASADYLGAGRALVKVNQQIWTGYGKPGVLQRVGSALEASCAVVYEVDFRN